MQRDYYIEYYEFVDKLLWEFVDEIKILYPEAFQVGAHSCEIAVVGCMYFDRYCSFAKESYSRLRNNGQNEEEVQRIYKNELAKIVNKSFSQPAIVMSKNNEILNTLLQPFRHCILVHIINKRQLDYLTPLIRHFNQPVLLVSDYELPDETDFPDSITAVHMGFLKEKYFSPFLYQHFPYVYHYCNTYDQLLNILQPSCTIVLEGGNFQQEIIAVISKNLSIPCVCIQQGWPSVFHSNWLNLQYAYFFTWGNMFNDLFKTHNPMLQYVPVGYIYQVLPSKPKRYVTFFMQSLIGLGDQNIFQSILDLLFQCAALCPASEFCIREHPSYRLPEEELKRLQKLGNIKVVTNEPLADVFAETILAVSHYSSCLMEGIVHECIPFVFDPVCDSRYYPDVEKMGLGIIASSTTEALEKMQEFLMNPLQRAHFSRKMNEMKSSLFTSFGYDALNKIVENINKIVDMKYCTK